MTASIAQRIGVFNEVRNREYRLDIWDRAQDQSCRTKAARLQDLFGTIGISSQQICCRFLWCETALPLDLAASAPFPEFQHWFLRVRIPETQEWVSVDPTWDAGLKDFGLSYCGMGRIEFDHSGRQIVQYLFAGAQRQIMRCS